MLLRSAKLGPDHLDTIATKDGLASLKVVRGQTDLAEALFNEVLAVRKEKLGPHHPDTLGTQVVWHSFT